MSTDMQSKYQKDIAAAVEAKLLELDKTDYHPSTGRRYQMAGENGDGSPMTPAEHRENLRRGLTDIAERLGLHFFLMANTVMLDQLVTMSMIRNHDTAGLLKSLINSFMIAYIHQETTDQAYTALLALETCRAYVEKGGDIKKQSRH